jgi:hypothetical protein
VQLQLAGLHDRADGEEHVRVREPEHVLHLVRERTRADLVTRAQLLDEWNADRVVVHVVVQTAALGDRDVQTLLFRGRLLPVHAAGLGHHRRPLLPVQHERVPADQGIGAERVFRARAVVADVGNHHLRGHVLPVLGPTFVLLVLGLLREGREDVFHLARPVRAQLLELVRGQLLERVGERGLEVAQ